MRRGRPKRLVGKNKTLLLTALILVVAGIFLVIHMLSQPAEGVIATTPPASPPEQIDISRTKTITGKYIAFDYPLVFEQQKTAKPTGSELESYTFIKRASPLWSLSISASQLSSARLADDGSYNFRKANPSRYKLNTWPVGGITYEIFSDQSENYSKTAFGVHGKVLVTLSLTSNDVSSAALLDSALNQILTSLKWVQ